MSVDPQEYVPVNDAAPHAMPEGRRSATYPFLFRWLHWLLVPSTLLLILTGFSLHAGSRPDWSLFGGKVPSWFWTGRVHYWHAWAAIVFTPAILAACCVYARRRVRFRPTHLILLSGGTLCVLSGFFLVNSPGSELLYSASLWVHAVVGMVILPIWFLWHLLTGLTRYVKMLVPAFHPWANPQWLPVVGWLVLVAVTSCILMNGWPLRWPWRDLVAKRIAQSEVVDLTALPWGECRPLETQLANGNGLSAGRTRIEFRALHDGEELFVNAVWADDTEDYGYWPWKKTDGGWEYMQTSAKDECRYYEDKFSLIFPVQPCGDFERFGCAASCHLDSKFGWGYKGSKDLLDTWHWKSVRTDPVGQVDDQYCTEVDFAQKDIGRHGDPDQGGGYIVNCDPKKEHPLFLPDAPEAVVHGSFPKSRAVEYTDAAGAAIPSGTIIPGVVNSPFLGDRGDIRCQSQYRDGHWNLYMRRKLDTGSKFDTQFAPGGQFAFGCAAFDHAGKRHAYALPVFHLVLEP
jgi:hypothetical protein